MFLADIADRGSLWDGRSPFPVACACHLLSARHWGCSAATPAAAAKLFPVAAGTLAMRERELLARLGDVAASLPWLAHASRGEPLVHLRSIRRAVELEWALHGEADARREPEAEMGDPQSDERLSQRERESVGEERVVGERNGEEKKREERNGAERDGEERNGEAATTSGRSAPATDGARPRGSQRRRSRSRSPSRSPTGGDLGDRGPAPATRLLRCFPHASAPGPAPEGERGSVLGGRDWAPPLVERREAKRRDAVALVGEEASRLEVATAPVLWGRGEEGKEGVRSEVDRVGGAPRAEKRRREERERRVAVRRMLLDGWSKGDVVEALLRRGGIGVGGAYGQVMYGAH